jgi:hypothetical protein
LDFVVGNRNNDMGLLGDAGRDRLIFYIWPLLIIIREEVNGFKDWYRVKK